VKCGFIPEQYGGLIVTLYDVEANNRADKDALSAKGMISATDPHLSDLFAGIYIRSLYDVWAHGTGNASFTSYIEAYIAIQVPSHLHHLLDYELNCGLQYNALNDLASDGRDHYNSDWHGPAVGIRTPDGVLASTAALVGAIGPNIPNSAPTPTPAPTR
jgi:hypothetical protein